MIKEHLQNITGVEIYAIIGFLIFFVFFVMVTIHTIKLKRKDVERFKQLPLEEEVKTIESA